MIDTSKLKQINDTQADKRQADSRYEAILKSHADTRNTILSAFASLIRYLEGHTSKTELVNQLEEVGTPDVMKVVVALESLHETLKTHENTDLTEVTTLMQKLLEQAEKIPKELPEQKEFTQIDYSRQFESLTKAVFAVEEVVKSKDLHVEAPVINVPETVVNVDAPDLTPLEKGHKDIVDAVKGIVIPEYKTDNKELEKLVRKSNKLLEDLLDKPTGGGGGGGRVSPYEDAQGIPKFVVLENGNVPIVEGFYTNRYDYADTSLIYTGYAPLGTDDAEELWTITKYDLTDTSNANGKVALNTSWADRAAGSYA